MGSGGTYYDRGVSVATKSFRGVTAFAQETMSQNKLNEGLLPFERRLVSTCRSPLAYSFDVTGSMDVLPLLICDKWPMVAGQIVIHEYLNDVRVSLSAIGDIMSDSGPLQVCDFAKIKDLDPQLKKIWLEKGGGGQHFESYEFMAYFYARLYEMQNAVLPIFIFTGDESFREKLSGKDLTRRFGGQHNDTNATTVFEELKKKFMGNVFLLHRYYSSYGLDSEIVSQWEGVLGRDHVIRLPEDPAVADLTLGIIALVSGKRTLKGYEDDMRGRPLEMDGKKYKPQSEERIKLVIGALEPLEEMLKSKRKTASKLGKTPVRPKQEKKKGGLKI